ncbi:hypothetical protein [uncultured Metabacillus sp.]|uniref:hypothetical protein n=1 Tax=uncultured Metabacillus sp. TaxID=2860135 RepID=UPI0026127854|nr:hypothetical protein [uncultured Metabacillus sp.]
MSPYMMRNRPYPDGRFFFGGPFIGGFLGGLVGSAIFRPRPPFYPYFPYGGSPYGKYGYGYGYGYPPYGGGFPY